MNLCELRPAEGSREKNWRRGRGHATGNGKTAVSYTHLELAYKGQIPGVKKASW